MENGMLKEAFRVFISTLVQVTVNDMMHGILIDLTDNP